MSASIKQEIIEQLDKLPIELQRRVLDFTHALVMSETMAKAIKEGCEQVDKNVMIIERLMKIYEDSKLNKGKPECIFAETLIFNEGWLLRGVLQRWVSDKCQSKFRFLPFPDDVKIYSEAQLYTPFKKRSQHDKQGEGNTHVDGIVGDFIITPDSKSGVVLNSCDYLAVFEAKLYGELAKGVKFAVDFTQVSRSIACIINAVSKLKTENNTNSIHFVVIYPSDNKKIEPEKFTKCFIEDEIQKRLNIYEKDYASKMDDNFPQFKERWRDILKNIKIHFITWECVLSEFEDQDIIRRFYELCKKFSSK